MEHNEFFFIIHCYLIRKNKGDHDGEQYGYFVWKELSQRFGIKIKIPTVYQHLADLERLALIGQTKTAKVFGTPERKYYSITDRGQAVLEALKRMNPVD